MHHRAFCSLRFLLSLLCIILLSTLAGCNAHRAAAPQAKSDRPASVPTTSRASSASGQIDSEATAGDPNRQIASTVAPNDESKISSDKDAAASAPLADSLSAPAPSSPTSEIAGGKSAAARATLASAAPSPDGRMSDRENLQAAGPELRAKAAADSAPSGLSAGVSGEGKGPGESGDKFATITENRFLLVKDSPLSTFSIDVDTASYSKVRQYVQETHTLPPRDAVRIEELVNYFDYQYAPPINEHPFAVHLDSADCPWQPENRLVRIGLKGKELARDQRPVTNLVFLIDTSGSMMTENKLPLVKRGMEMLADQLGENDRVSMVVYAGSAGLVLPPTGGDNHQAIREALDHLQAGGSTNGGAGIHLAYDTARENFVKNGVNRVILCSDGDFNVGTTSTSDLVQLAESNAKSGVFLTVLGFGIGNHNDAMLEQLSDKANGNYYFIDNEGEARKVLVDQMTGTLTTIAKDVKIQVEFNPALVASYRLLGYENRLLADRDFNDDKKDAGEIGAGHTVTALYEIKPVKPSGEPIDLNDSEIDDLKYQSPRELAPGAKGTELLTVKLRYKQPTSDTSTLLSVPLADKKQRFGEAAADFQFAGAVAMFGMLLRNSEYATGSNWNSVLEIASASAGNDPKGYRAQFVELVKAAKAIAPEKVSAIK